MPNKVQPFTLSPAQAAELAAVVQRGDGFQVVGPSELPSFTPATLKAKVDSATRIVSGSTGDHPVVMYNFRRIDGANVDEHPYGALLVSGSTAVSSSFLEHGNWHDRTTPISAQHAAEISGSGIGGYFLAHPPSGLTSGSLDELPASDESAFKQFIASAVAHGV